MEEFDLVLILGLGLIIGSFLNMLIYRLPLGVSLINPKRSICTSCSTAIKWYENIPVLSYLYLQGKCSSCKKKISVIYPIVEILTALVTLILYKKLSLSNEFFFIIVLFYLLILLSFIDFKYKAVPDYLLIIVTIVILSYLFFYKMENIPTYFIFAGGILTIELFVTYYIQNIKSYLLKDDSLKEQKAMGEGDIPIVALMGGLLGLKFGLIAIFLSAILAIIPSIINIVSKKEIETPFIPYLSAALFITYVYENQISNILEGLQIG